MDKISWTLLLIFIAGLVIIIIPDPGPPVLRLNEDHGPSFTDVLGLCLVMTSWLSCLIMIIRYWNGIILRKGRLRIAALILLYLISVTAIIIALKRGRDWELWLAVSFASLINLIFIVLAFRERMKLRDRSVN